MKRKITIALITLLVIVVISIVGYKTYSSYETKKDNNAIIYKINNDYSIFEKEQNRNEKIKDLKSTVSEFSKYTNKDIVNNYNEKIKNMRQYFINEYDKSLKDNSVSSEDKDSLTKQINNLNTLLNTIKSEKDTVLNKESLYVGYQTKINEIVKNDTTKIQEIDAAKAAVAKAEAEKKAAEDAANVAAAKSAEETKAKAATSNATTKASAPNTANQTNNSNIPDNGHGGTVIYTWSIDANGNEIPGTRLTHYQNGDVTDTNGNTVNMSDY